MGSDDACETLFSCTLCGDCCKGYGGTYLSETDIDAIAVTAGPGLIGGVMDLDQQTVGAGGDIGEDAVGDHVAGVDQLGGATYRVIPDRIEAGTFMIAAAITGGNVLVRGAVRGHQEALISKMIEAGVRVEDEERGLRVIGPKKLQSVDIRTS